MDDDQRVTYRLPEESIKLSFLEKLGSASAKAGLAPRPASTSVLDSMGSSRSLNASNNEDEDMMVIEETKVEQSGIRDRRASTAPPFAEAATKPSLVSISPSSLGASTSQQSRLGSNEAREWLLGLSSFVDEVSTFVVNEDTNRPPSADPYANETNLDVLYKAAIGDMDDDLRVASESRASLNGEDPLFQQFLAWRRLMRLRQTLLHENK